MSRSSIAARLASAKTNGGSGNWINPGKGILIVKALKEGTKPEFHGGDTFVAELMVESCEGFAGVLDSKTKGTKPVGNNVGSDVSYTEKLSGEWEESALGRCRSFLLTLMGETDASIAALAVAQKKTPDDVFADAYGNLVDRLKNPARGMRIAYSTYEKETGKGEMITVPKWESVTQTTEQIAQARALLDRKAAEPKAAPAATGT